MSDVHGQADNETIALLEQRINALEQTMARKLRAVRWAALSIVAAFGIVTATVLVAQTDAGKALFQVMDFSTPPVSAPPLDASVRWERRDPVNAKQGDTNALLALIADANQRNSNTWPLYIQLNATTDPNATVATSGNVGAYVRAFNRSAGSPWLAAYHSEIYHGFTSLGGQQVETNGTSILFNGELLSKSSHGVTIGLNLQNTPDSTGPGTYAINIQSANPVATWRNGIHFDGAGTVGDVGINFANAHFASLGMDLGNNSLRLNGGQRIFLDQSSAVYLTYNAQARQVQLVKSGKTVAVW